jgi:hypothetical protein
MPENCAKRRNRVIARRYVSNWRWLGRNLCRFLWQLGCNLSVAMFRFDLLISPSMTVREIKRRFPQTISVFETFGFRHVCDDCSLETVARRAGVPVREVVEALNHLVVPQSGKDRQIQ